MRAVVEQLPVGGPSAVLSPQVAGTEFVVGAESAQTHLFVVAQEHGHVGGFHDLLQQIDAAGAPIDHIPKDV